MMTILLTGEPSTLRVSGVRARAARTPWLNRIVIALAAVMVITAIVGPFIAPGDVNTSNIRESFLPPSGEHWMGTDEQGRDVFWRVIVGARASIGSSALVVLGFSVIGVVVALLAVLGGRLVDGILMRTVDGILALPPIVFALALAAVLGYGLGPAIVALILTSWPVTARLLRGTMRETMQSTFVKGAWVLGVPRWKIMLRHVLPNSMDVLIVMWAAELGFTILSLSSLSFIGVGAQPPSPEWGAMVNDAAGYMSRAWWAGFFPGLAIAVAVTCFGLIGDMLQVRLNPELREASQQPLGVSKDEEGSA
jgi:peptide/nickel transport system permease protein